MSLISYPHGQKNVLLAIVNDFVDGLKREIVALDCRPLRFDQVLTGGRRIDDAIGSGLCKSACMIMLYMPLYYSQYQRNKASRESMQAQLEMA